MEVVDWYVNRFTTDPFELGLLVCCSISDHVTILLRILAFKFFFTNSCMYIMNNF